MIKWEEPTLLTQNYIKQPTDSHKPQVQFINGIAIIIKLFYIKQKSMIDHSTRYTEGVGGCLTWFSLASICISEKKIQLLMERALTSKFNWKQRQNKSSAQTNFWDGSVQVWAHNNKVGFIHYYCERFASFGEFLF